MTDGGVFPDGRQTLLLRAAVGTGDDARAAWAEWRASGDLDDVDEGSYRLLPQLYRNLSALGVDDPWLGRLKGTYRYHWYHNQMLLHTSAAAVRALEDAGMPTLMLKGAALVTLHYGDVGARPMGDIDVLVPRERAREAFGILRAAGFAPATEANPEDVLALIHAEPFARPGGHAVDLHWYALWLPTDDEDFWAASVPFEVAGAQTRALDPADQLLHVCIHGLRWQESSQIRWAADAAMVIRSAGAALDWERFLERVRARRLTVPLAAALGYVSESLGTPVPARALESLRAAPSSRFDRAAFRAALQPPPRAARALLLVDRYRRLRQLGDPDFEPGLLRFVARSRRLEHSWQLAASIARRHLGARLGQRRAA